MEQLKIENQELKQRVEELTRMLSTERTVNVQLLKQKNGVMEELGKMKLIIKDLQKVVEMNEAKSMAKSVEINRVRRINSDLLSLKNEDIHSKLGTLSTQNNPERIFTLPLKTLEPSLTERFNSLVSYEQYTMRPFESSRDKHNTHQMRPKSHLENSNKPGVDMTLIPKRPKSKITLSRKYL